MSTPCIIGSVNTATRVAVVAPLALLAACGTDRTTSSDARPAASAPATLSATPTPAPTVVAAQCDPGPVPEPEAFATTVTTLVVRPVPSVSDDAQTAALSQALDVEGPRLLSVDYFDSADASYDRALTGDQVAQVRAAVAAALPGSSVEEEPTAVAMASFALPPVDSLGGQAALSGVTADVADAARAAGAGSATTTAVGTGAAPALLLVTSGEAALAVLPRALEAAAGALPDGSCSARPYVPAE